MCHDGPEDLRLPDWLEVDSLLPTMGEWKEQSSVTGHIRSHSSVVKVDAALEAYWKDLTACIKSSGSSPKPEAVKQTLEALLMACTTYLQGQVGQNAMFLGQLLGEEPPSRAFEVIVSGFRTIVKNTHKERLPPAIGLRWAVGLEHKRLEDWKTGVPPRADLAEAWGAFTCMPSVEIWKYESSGGADKGWTLRSRSQITKVDAALEKFWEPFFWLQKDETLTALGAVISACETYIKHKEQAKPSDKKPRLAAARRLLFRAQHEKKRFEGWKLLVPPRLPAFSVTEGQEVDVFSSGDAFMELRTAMPTPAIWRERSSRTAKIRSKSSIVRLVDEPLDLFWTVFLRKDRLGSLVALANVTWGARAYRLHKGEKSEDPRAVACGWLAKISEDEFARLAEEWPTTENALPPIFCDNDAGDEPEIVQEAQDDLKALEQEVDPQAMQPLDGQAVTKLINDTTESGPLTSEEQRMMDLLADKKKVKFGHSDAYAQVLVSPSEASEAIFKLYASEKKWVKRQLAAIQSASLVNYPSAIAAKLKDKPVSLKKHEDLFAAVVSVADHVAREMYQKASTSSWKVLNELRWTEKATDLVLPMSSVATILFACKWKDSKTATIVGGVKGFGVKRAVFTGFGAALTLTTSTESVYKLFEHAHFIKDLDPALGGLSVFGVASSGINVPMSVYSVIDSMKTHHQLSTMAERFAALQAVQPAIVEFIDSSPLFFRLREALIGKVGRRKTRAKITGISSTLSIGSTVVGIVITVTAANAWNPLGWTLAGLAAVGSIGLLAYKIGRKSVQKKKLQDLRDKYHIPPFVTTAGEWQRYQIADLMFRAALNDASMGPQLLGVGFALLFLVLGGSVQEYRDSALKMGHSGIMAFIKG